MVVMLAEWVVTAIFLILVVLALRAALGGRVSAGLRYGLWAVVLVRLLVPVQLFTSPLAGTRVFSGTQTEQNIYKVTDEGLEKGGPGDIQALGGQDGPSVTLTTFPQAPNPPAVPDVPEPPAAPDLTKAPAWLGWAWLAGSAAVAFVLLLSNLRFYWSLRRVRVPLDEADLPLRVYVAVGLPSPCLFGLFRPAIYVTPEAAADPDMLRHVLAHEYTHYRHGDHLWSLLRCAALAAHWWNPLVWLSAVLSRRDAELACDEGALKRLGDGERAGYGSTLLALVTAKPQPGDLFRCATTMTGDKKSLKERIARIASAPKRILWAVIVAVLVTALACVCAFGQAAEEPEEDDPEPSVEPSAEPSRDLNYTENGWDLEMRDAVTLEAAPDLNRNGVPETLVVGDFYNKEDLRLPEEEREKLPFGWVFQGVEVWEGDQLLWTGLASDMHAGEDSFLLYSEGGEDYLMEFNIYGQQGRADGDYRLFTLENGRENTVRESHVEFHYCTDSLASVKDHFNPVEVAAFVDEVDGLLEHCTLLVDTGANYHKDELRVNVDWLMFYAGLQWDYNGSTLDNMIRFKLWAEGPAYVSDLNRNGISETVTRSEIGEGSGQRVELYEGEKVIWSEEGYHAHAGYNAIFLCTLDGRPYLLRYHPYMGQGRCTYTYELFNLTRDGKENVVRENSVSFDLNFGSPIHESFDPEAIAAFMEEINGLLANSVQLLNTDADLLDTFQREGRLYDSLGWLDWFTPVFVRDPSKSMLENLRGLQAAEEARAYAETPTVFPVDELGTDIKLDYRDKSTRFKGEWDYHFQPAEYVEPEVLDLNGDGRDEIVVILISGHGTGCLIENLYVFDADTLGQYDTSGLNEMILDSIESTGDEDSFYLSAPWMDRVTVPKDVVPYHPVTESGHNPVADALALGEIVEYRVENGRVVCRLGCDASGMTTNYIGYLDVTLDFTPQGGFRCAGAQYDPVEE